jgi:hypothetical protein
VNSTINKIGKKITALSKAQETLIIPVLQVFSNRTLLEISFRTNSKIEADFLRSKIDLDHETLDEFVALCKEHDIIQAKIFKCMVKEK